MAAVSPKRSDVPTSLKSLIYYEFQLQRQRSFCATNISLNNANKITSSHFSEENWYLGEKIGVPCFPLGPRVFHQRTCFPPKPVFSTRPRVFHTPYFPPTGILAPRFPPILKISPCSRSPENEEFGHFTLLFCRGRKRNVQRIITHVHRRCFAH